MTGDRIASRDYREISVSGQGQYAERDITNYGKEQQQSLAQAAKEIQALLEQLDKTYPTDTMSGQIDAAKEVMSRIKGDMSLADRILSAVRVGGIEALKQILNHPAASFVLGFIDEWQKTKATKAISDKDPRSNITSALPLGQGKRI